MNPVRNPRRRWLKAVETKGGAPMNNNDDAADQMLDFIATEPAVLARIYEDTGTLVGIRQAKVELAKMPAETLRAAMQRRHAVLGEGA